MRLGRQLPYRLSFVALVAALLFAGCASDRYVGSIGRDGTYSNRGYGLAIPLAQGGLDQRWTAIDPGDLEKYPSDVRPEVRDEPIDLDGNGELEMGETTHYLRPMLRLLSKTSTGAVMSIDVTLLGKNNASIGIDQLMVLELQKETKTATAAGALSKAEVPSGYPACMATVQGARFAHRIALVDQNDFTGESGAPRRQIVRVMLSAKALTPELEKDLDLLLAHLILGRRGGSETSGERW